MTHFISNTVYYSFPILYSNYTHCSRLRVRIRIQLETHKDVFWGKLIKSLQVINSTHDDILHHRQNEHLKGLCQQQGRTKGTDLYWLHENMKTFNMCQTESSSCTVQDHWAPVSIWKYFIMRSVTSLTTPQRNPARLRWFESGHKALSTPQNQKHTKHKLCTVLNQIQNMSFKYI